MLDNSAPLKTTFSWLTEGEAIAIAQRIELLPPARSAADALTSIAQLLDSHGLPPTSNLLLALAGRGSKSQALEIARQIARARFERASGDERPAQVTMSAQVQHLPALPVTPHVHGAQPSQIPGEAQLEEIRQAVTEAMAGLQPAADGKILALLESMRGEITWLKSTIDSERQLRRYFEKHGPLNEPAAPAQTAAGRMQAVSSLTSTLERDRYKAPNYARDPADGASE